MIYKWLRYLTFQPLKKKKKKVIEVWATKNFKKDKIRGRVNIFRCIFEKIAKKVKIEVTGFKKAQFLNIFSKMGLEYIDPSGHFVFFMKFCVGWIFLVELHLDDVLEVLLVVEPKFVCTKLVDKYYRKIHWITLTAS